MAGTLVGFLCQDTTTTTGTGAITLANSVPSGAPAGSTTFGAFFAPTGSFQTAPGNTFYTIIDGSGNIECGLGTLTSNTNLTRDYVLGSYTGGAIAVANQTGGGGHVNFASGTKNVYSNASLFAASVAAWQRIPDDNAANIFNQVMSGTFTGVLTDGVGTTNVTIRYKVTNDGSVQFQIPTATVNNTGTSLSITGIPAFLCNTGVSSGAMCVVTGTAAGGVNVPGYAILASGATPTSTGTITFQQYAVVATGFTATFTASVVRGIVASTITFGLY